MDVFVICSDNREHFNCSNGVAEHVGHSVTSPILINNSREDIDCSNVHSTDDPLPSNLCLDLFYGEKASPDFVKTLREVNQDQNIMLISSEDMNQTSIVKCIENTMIP